MTISFVFATTLAAASGTPWQFTVPTSGNGAAAGDQAYVFLDAQSVDVSLDTPTDWILHDSKLSSGDRHLLFRKTLVAGDLGQTVGAPLAGAAGGSSIRRMAQCIVMRGCNAVPHAYGWTAESVTTAAHTIPSVAATVANWASMMHVAERLAVGSSDFTPPSASPTWTEQIKQLMTGSSQISAETDTQIGSTSAGTVGGGVVTGSVPSLNAGVWTVVLSPTGSSPTYVNGGTYMKHGGTWI